MARNFKDDDPRKPAVIKRYPLQQHENKRVTCTGMVDRRGNIKPSYGVIDESITPFLLTNVVVGNTSCLHTWVKCNGLDEYVGKRIKFTAVVRQYRTLKMVGYSLVGIQDVSLNRDTHPIPEKCRACKFKGDGICNFHVEPFADVIGGCTVDRPKYPVSTITRPQPS